MHNASANGELQQEHVKEKADQLQQLSLGKPMPRPYECTSGVGVTDQE